MLITRVLRAEMSTEQTCKAAQRMCFQRCAALTKSAVVRYQTDFAGTTWYIWLVVSIIVYFPQYMA